MLNDRLTKELKRVTLKTVFHFRVSWGIQETEIFHTTMFFQLVVCLHCVLNVLTKAFPSLTGYLLIFRDFSSRQIKSLFNAIRNPEASKPITLAAEKLREINFLKLPLY